MGANGNGGAIATTAGAAKLPHISVLKLQREYVGTVEIEGEDGSPKTVGVRQFDGATFHAHANVTRAGSEGAIEALYEIARRLMPEATEAEVMALNPKAIGSILTLAAGMVTEVEQHAEGLAEGNAEGSEREPSQAEVVPSRGI